MTMSCADIRASFLEYFKNKQHEVVASSSLVPHNDATLLFTNAGMVQFKDVFLGNEKRDNLRATTSQRCVRAGGKHNDLDNVGYTARHHTFFEMLGNFSFGDYFKREAIQFAWEYITEVLKIPKEKLWVTVFEEDEEAKDIWINEMGFPANRLTKCGVSSNFWAMGDTGPCGPCTEIFYDHGESVQGGPPGTPEEDGDRYVEIWNMVFMQYNRTADGVLHPLPKPSVDTGMGLERLAAVLQGVKSNYDIDLFQSLLKASAKAVGVKDEGQPSLRVIADHIRSCAFLIVDGVVPSNEGRGYVLRRIIRRAVRHGYKLGQKKPFFYTLVNALVKAMGEAYPELMQVQEHVERVLQREEKQFAITLAQGMKLLEEAVGDLDGKMIPGETVFKLYDTYGFPVDLTADIAREKGLEVDGHGFQDCMAKQRQQSREASQFEVDYNAQGDALRPLLKGIETPPFIREAENLSQDAVVSHLFCDSKEVSHLEKGESGAVVLNKTSFYPEGGGQVGDQGVIIGRDNQFTFHVSDTRRIDQAIVHFGEVLDGKISKNEKVTAKVDVALRKHTERNHSATHLLHHVLRQVLGDHVLQKGSLVAPDRLRFDFSHTESVTPQQLQAIEDGVNHFIQSSIQASTEEMTPDSAKKKGALALFGEKYGKKVRVLTMGDSVELCGGTHVSNTANICLFKIIGESGVAAGVRRIEALTGEGARQWFAETIASQQVALKEAQQREREAQKKIEKLEAKVAGAKGNALLNDAQKVGEVSVITSEIEGGNPKSLRETLDRLKQQVKKGVIVLAAVQGDKVSLIAGVTDDLTDTIKAGDVVKHVASQVGGKGGGRADMAQAGGTLPAALPGALTSVKKFVEGCM